MGAGPDVKADMSLKTYVKGSPNDSVVTAADYEEQSQTERAPKTINYQVRLSLPPIPLWESGKILLCLLTNERDPSGHRPLPGLQVSATLL